MKIANHICFFFNESRIVYLNRIIDETNRYPYETDIFIHTNNIEFNKDALNAYTNGQLNIVYHDLSGIDPHYLAWKCRPLLAEQKDAYDIFMYIEDDILVPVKALNYWLERNERLIELNYNLGFVRIEVNDIGEEYMPDLYNGRYNDFIEIDHIKYAVNNMNPYCAFWIYNKNEFHKFIDSKYYDLNNIPGYGTREKSAIGLHGINNPWYTNTVIPVVDNKLISDCKIYHMPNNYIGGCANVQFIHAI